MIGAGLRIETVAEFNRRALPALRGLASQRGFVHSMIKSLADGITPTDAEQRALYNLVRDRRRQITDALLVEFALGKVKGAD